MTNLAEHKTFTAHGFELTAYPGFASRVRVLHGAGTEQVIYEQAAPFMVPPGLADADTRHVLRLRGGEHNRDVGLVIDDPHHQVARITIELYDQSNTSETKHAVETVIIDNDPVRCPPAC